MRAEPPSDDSGLEQKRSCIAAHAAAQRARHAERLREARAQSARCADEECPEVVRQECGAWLQELAKDQPSVLFVARDGRGRALMDVEVREGAVQLVERLDGRSLEVDPGTHRFRFTRGAESVEVVAFVRAGDKQSLIEAVFNVPAADKARRGIPAKPSLARRRGLPTESWILGGVGAVGFASAVYFGLTGLSRQRDMESGCAPRCASGEIDDMQRRYLVADISLGVGLLATAGALWFALAAPEH